MCSFGARPTSAPRVLRLVALASVLLAAPALAQDEPVVLPPPPRQSLDARLFHSVYDVESPAFEGVMRGVNGVATPIFIAAVPAHGLGVLAADASGGPVGRMLVSELAVMGEIFLLKTLVRRARPFVTLPDVTPRQRRPPSGLDPYSFPSGHAALAFTLATSASLSYPEWYVIAPALTWATATALARVWHGMHYPSDIVIGAALGAGTAMLVHVLLDGSGGEEGTPATLTLRIPL